MMASFEAETYCINLLKPTGYAMHQQIEHSAVVRSAHTAFTCVFLFIYLRADSDFCQLQRKLIGFYNGDEKCLQRGTDWAFE
jgi:hypothetical protein